MVPNTYDVITYDAPVNVEEEEGEDEDEEEEEEEDKKKKFPVAETMFGCVDDLAAGTRTHKSHAFSMIPNQIERNGSLDVGNSRIFETFHRRLQKACTRSSNNANLGLVERQVIRNVFASMLFQEPRTLLVADARNS